MAVCGHAIDETWMTARPYAAALDRLRRSGLRPTRQRLALTRLLFDAGDRHVTAEQLHSEAEAAGVSVSLATVYNTLHHFTDGGLLRAVVVEAGRSYFDTTVGRHHHFFDVATGPLADLPAHATPLPPPPPPPHRP